MSARVPRFRNLASGAARWLSARPLTHALLDAPDAVPVLGRLVAARLLTSSSPTARAWRDSPSSPRSLVCRSSWTWWTWTR